MAQGNDGNVINLPIAESISDSDKVVGVVNNEVYNVQIGDIVKKSSGLITDKYNAENNYEVGDYAIYQDVLYKCVEETNGQFDFDKWEATTMARENRELKSTLSNLADYEAQEIKFPDGTMIAYGTYAQASCNIGSAWGNLFEGAATANINFKTPFVARPVIYAMSNSTSGMGFFVRTANIDNSKIISFSLMRPTSAQSNIAIDWVAYGRWK